MSLPSADAGGVVCTGVGSALSVSTASWGCVPRPCTGWDSVSLPGPPFPSPLPLSPRSLHHLFPPSVASLLVGTSPGWGDGRCLEFHPQWGWVLGCLGLEFSSLAFHCSHWRGRWGLDTALRKACRGGLVPSSWQMDSGESGPQDTLCQPSCHRWG